MNDNIELETIKSTIRYIEYLQSQNNTPSIDIKLVTAKNSLQSQLDNRWIPVSEKLPEQYKKSQDVFDIETLAVIDTNNYMASDQVLVMVKALENNELFVCDDYIKEGKWDTFDNDDFKIIAWRPFPELYKE
jgi:hypothetical protein